MDDRLDPGKMSYWVREAYEAILRATAPDSALSGYDQRLAIVDALDVMQASMENDLY